MSRNCCVCAAALGEPDFSGSAPSITSVATVIDLPLNVWICHNCSHAQSDELPDLADYYDTQYRISMVSDDHDQLYEVKDGIKIFRNDKQAELVEQLLDLDEGARILDFGAGKATTLRKLFARRPDLQPHVFDVSKDYVAHWSGWLPKTNWATYQLPQEWQGHFDAVTAHFVMEHVADPVALLRELRKVLKTGGKLFVSVPDVLANPGDLLVADHTNHFTQSSLQSALLQTGFEQPQIDASAFDGALVAVARAGEVQPATAPGSDELVAQMTSIADFWKTKTKFLQQAAGNHSGRPSAIYGAGFYGSFIFATVSRSADLQCFVDRNPHVKDRPHLGLAVMDPAALPDNIEVVYAGLNPHKARAILSDVPEWRGRKLTIQFLDEVASGDVVAG